MSPNISIRPSKDIRTNYAQISALTRQNPVAITVNGKEDTVLLSHEDFQDQLHYIGELEAKLAVYSHLAQRWTISSLAGYRTLTQSLTIFSVNWRTMRYEL